MTRIDTPLAQPTPEKPVDKTTGKGAQKDGDDRQTAFRSLLRQLGGQAPAAHGCVGKSAKDVSGEAPRPPSLTRHRISSKEDEMAEPPQDALATEMPAEPVADGESLAGLQAMLGGEQRGQTSAAVDLTALVTPRAPAAEGPGLPPEKIAPAADRPGRLPSMTPPSNTDLNLDFASGHSIGPQETEQTDPFAALSSLLDRETDAVVESEGVDIAPIKMSVVTRETHFEPVSRLSPVQQIATAIGDDLAALAEPAAEEAVSRPAEPTRHSSGPLKVLHLKLEPEDLGAVVLKMRLVDKSLELEVVASRQETADLLAKDRDMLTRALRASGYTADVVTITTSTSPDSGQMTGDNRSGGQAPSGNSGAQAGANGDSNNAAGGGNRPSARPHPMEGAFHEDSGDGHSGSDLYL